MKLTSPAFKTDDFIPEQYTCKGLNISPPLKVQDFPANAQSFTLIMHDPDSASGHFIHWLGYNIEPTEFFPENSPLEKEGKNDFGKIGYGGPSPSKGTHRYIIRVYALDTMLLLPDRSSTEEVEKAMQGHIIDSAELRGFFSLT